MIAEIRGRRGIEPEEFAAMIEEDRRGLERIERGEVDAEWGTLRLVARGLGLPLDRLIELAEEAAPGKGGADWRRWAREAEATWTMSEPWAGPGAEGRGVFYPDLLGELLDVQLFAEAHDGFPAVEGELVGDGVVRTDERLVAFVLRVAAEGLDARDARFEPLPYLWFSFQGEIDGLDGFLIEIETLLRALKACRAPDQPQPPVPVYAAKEPWEGSLRAGEPRLLRMGVVDLERPSLGEAGPQLGIFFEILDGDGHPLHSFTMEGLTPFLAIGVPLLAKPPALPRRPSFGEELGFDEDEGR